MSDLEQRLEKLRSEVQQRRADLDLNDAIARAKLGPEVAQRVAFLDDQISHKQVIGGRGRIEWFCRLGLRSRQILLLKRTLTRLCKPLIVAAWRLNKLCCQDQDSSQWLTTPNPTPDYLYLTLQAALKTLESQPVVHST